MSLTISAVGFKTAAQEAERSTFGQQIEKKTIYGGKLDLANNPVAQRREQARKQAWNVVKNAWENDRSVDDMIQKRRGHYAELSVLRDELDAGISRVNEQKENLRKFYGVQEDSGEQKDLELLEKEQDYNKHILSEELTAEERVRLEEIHKQPLTEYQARVLELNDYAGEVKKQRADAEREMQDDVANIGRIKLERLKTHAMVDAQGAADEILDAANDEIIGMLIQDAKEHIDERMEEAKEKSEEAAEEKENRKDALDERKLERAVRQAMVLGTDDAVEKAKRIKQQIEAADIRLDDMVDLTTRCTAKKDVSQSLNDIKSNMKVLEADLKGIQVDEET